MDVSIDISMYPLEEEYCPSIIEFIDRLDANPNLKVERNSMSTQVFGEYKTVMAEMTDEMLIALEKLPTTVFVLKLIGTDRSTARIRSCE